MKFIDAHNNELNPESIRRGPTGWKDLFSELLDQLKKFREQNENEVLSHRRSFMAVKKAILNLQQFNSKYRFKEQQEEIYFFKEVKPLFFSLLIFHDVCYEVELRLSSISKERILRYLQRHLYLIDIFFVEYKFFHEYLLLEEKNLDDRFFVRTDTADHINSDIYFLSDDISPIAGYDYIFSRLLANKWIAQYITDKLTDVIEHPSHKTTKAKKDRLLWTDSNTALVELCYALQSSGSINHGKATVKQIVGFFEEWLDVDLGNTSHTFQEILRKKSGYTTYLDSLKKNLLIRIERNETRQF